MPKRFQACTANQPRKALMSCCLNTVGDGKKCTGCAKCTQKTLEGKSCSNTTCMDPFLCHVHMSKGLGVQLMDTDHGKGLQATRDFSVGEFIAPMGGKIMTDDWEDLLQTIQDFKVIERRDEGNGYYESDKAPVDVGSWSKSRVTSNDIENLRRAVLKDNYIYFVSKKDWKKFLTEANTEAKKKWKGISNWAINDAVVKMMDTPLERDLGDKFKVGQFEARAEINNRTSPYGYEMEGYGEYTFHKRDGGSGYIPASELKNPNIEFIEYDDVPSSDRIMMRALRRGTRIYLVRSSDWPKFRREAEKKASETVMRGKSKAQIKEEFDTFIGSRVQETLSRHFQPAQFEAYVEYLDSDDQEIVKIMTMRTT